MCYGSLILTEGYHNEFVYLGSRIIFGMGNSMNNYLGLDVHPTDQFLPSRETKHNTIKAAKTMREAYDKLVGTDKEALDLLLEDVREYAYSEGSDDGYESGYSQGSGEQY